MSHLSNLLYFKPPLKYTYKLAHIGSVSIFIVSLIHWIAFLWVLTSFWRQIKPFWEFWSMKGGKLQNVSIFSFIALISPTDHHSHSPKTKSKNNLLLSEKIDCRKSWKNVSLLPGFMTKLSFSSVSFFLTSSSSRLVWKIQSHNGDSVSVVVFVLPDNRAARSAKSPPLC